MESEGDGGASRRRQSLSDEKIDSANLRDFLRVKEDDKGLTTLAGLTLSAILSSNEMRQESGQPTRTLLDIIRDDPTGGGKDSKKSWKSFKDKLRLRRAGAAWTSSVPIPASDVPIQNSNRMITRRHSTRFQNMADPNSDDPTPESSQTELSSSSGGETRAELNSVPSNRAMMLRRNSSRIPERRVGPVDDSTPLYTSENNAAEPAEQHEQVPSTEGVAEEGAGEPAVRTSLMALLAETDRQMGLDGSAYIMEDDEEEDEGEEEEEEEEEKEKGGGGGEYNNCCVCMVRHKGAAFIPCGHTFCRLCSRELWVQRGNCPLCNNFILEILDIF